MGEYESVQQVMLHCLMILNRLGRKMLRQQFPTTTAVTLLISKHNDDDDDENITF